MTKNQYTADRMDHYIRLVVFTVEGCPKPLVELFLKKAKADIRPGCHYTNIDNFLQYHQPTIQNMLTRRFIRVDQVPLILPGPSDPPVDINKWDISLVTIMLQNIFKPLTPQEQRYIGDIRNIRNELLHRSGKAELDDRDFTAKWNTLEVAVTGLAQCVSSNFYNAMTSFVTDLKTKSLPPPGPALDILKQWYNTDNELHKDTLLAVEGAMNILNDVVVRRTKPSGKVMKKIKSIDPVLESMKEHFKITLKRYQNEDYQPTYETEDVKSKFRRYHRVLITGNGSLESALTVINDQEIRHDRCVQVSEPDEVRHVWCDDVDLVLCVNPFGKDLYDDRKSIEMTKQFDRLLEYTKLSDCDGRINVIIVSETGPFLEYCRLHDHDILDQVVALNKPTTEETPIEVSDCVTKTINQPEPILQNMIGHSGFYLEQFRDHHINEELTRRAKALFKKHKVINITGPKHVSKEILSVRLMTDYRPGECLILTKPGDWKYVKLGEVSVILISYFTGKGECDLILYAKWLTIFDLIHAAVKSGKLNVMLISHSSYLDECQSQKGTHDLLKQRIELTDDDMMNTNIKKETDDMMASTSNQVTYEEERHKPEETGDMLYDSKFINEICHRHGRKSKQLLLLCKKISKDIQAASHLIQCVWPGYTPLEPEKVVFVVFTEHVCEIDLPSHFGALDVVFKNNKSSSSEDKSVMSSEHMNSKSFTDIELNSLKTVLEKETEGLLNRHKRLSIVSACPIKSKNYGTHKAEITNELCIVLYVRVKGIIPIKEEHFPKKIDGFSTDIREGAFTFFGRSAKELQETLKSGCQISGNSGLNYGTLGPFVKDNQNNMCCLTSAHVLLSDNAYLCLQSKGDIDFTTDDVKAFQPSPSSNKHNFGHVSKGVFETGENEKAGVEVVLVKITDVSKIPSSNVFPEFPAENMERAGIGMLQPFTFAGKLCNSRPDTSVLYKVGCESGITRGVLHFQAVGDVQLDSFPYTRLHHQIQVRSLHSENFAEPGDSGALVFVAHNGDLSDLRAIGIVTGGVPFGAVVFVTPLKDILVKFKCSLHDFYGPMDCAE